jgi:hypothetical protein
MFAFLIGGESVAGSRYNFLSVVDLVRVADEHGASFEEIKKAINLQKSPKNIYSPRNKNYLFVRRR